MSEQVKLESINFGLLAEAFNRQMERVSANIADLATPAEAAREINLKIKITPWEDRNSARVEATWSAKLAKEMPQATVFFFEKDQNGAVRVFENNTRQGALPFDSTESQGVIVNRHIKIEKSEV